MSLWCLLHDLLLVRLWYCLAKHRVNSHQILDRQTLLLYLYAGGPKVRLQKKEKKKKRKGDDCVVHCQRKSSRVCVSQVCSCTGLWALTGLTYLSKAYMAQKSVCATDAQFALFTIRYQVC